MVMLLSIRRCVELPLQGLEHVDLFLLLLVFFCRVLTTALYSGDVGNVFVSSPYKNGLYRLGCSRFLSLLPVSIHIPQSDTEAVKSSPVVTSHPHIAFPWLV